LRLGLAGSSPLTPRYNQKAKFPERKTNKKSLSGLRLSVSAKRSAMKLANAINAMIREYKHGQTDLLSPTKNRLAGSNIPIESSFIQVRVRKHDVALAVEHVALPLLEAHGAK
jgi:hypothetical protein